MKRLSIIIYLLLCANSIQPQELDFDYRPFVEEGKVWVSKPEISFFMDGVLITDIVVEYDYFQGDTVVNDMLCKRWVQDYRTIHGERLMNYVIPMFEENKRIWFYLDGCEAPSLAYDFGAQKGDTIVVSRPYAHGYNDAIKHGRLDQFHASSRDTIVVTDKRVDVLQGKTMSLTYFLSVRDGRSDLSKWCADENYYVNGVGSHFCPDFNIAYTGGGNGSSWLMYCVVGDEILYADDEKAATYGISCPTPDTHPELFGIETSITSPQIVNSKSSNSKYYDLSGRRLSAPPAKGVYIENGKKRVAK